MSVVMPQGADGNSPLFGGRVVRWLRLKGDRVRQHEPIVEIQNDKVAMELSSPKDGVIKKIYKQNGDRFGPEDRLCEIE